MGRPRRLRLNQPADVRRLCERNLAIFTDYLEASVELREEGEPPRGPDPEISREARGWLKQLVEFLQVEWKRENIARLEKMQAAEAARALGVDPARAGADPEGRGEPQCH